MEIHSQEKKRAQNVIWNASEDYTFLSKFEVFDDRGEADLYWNFVIGTVHKYYDYDQLTKFFDDIKQDSDYPFKEQVENKQREMIQTRYGVSILTETQTRALELALCAALHMMSGTHYDHKIPIVLSDGKPIDPHGIAAGGSNPDLNFYSDTVGVNDAVFEVRKGRQNGMSGQDEDLPAAKKIYGNDLVCIKSPEKFADIVGVLIKNELRYL